MSDADVVTIKSIDEHPRVLDERLKSDQPGGIGHWQKAVAERDALLAAEKLKLQTAVLALQDRYSRLLEWVLEARAAVSKPLPS